MKSKNKYLVITFIMLFWGSMMVHLIVDNTNCPYDASTYWARGQECGWSVSNITDGFRGYALPYLFSMCYKFGTFAGSEFLGYRIFSSFIFAFSFSFSFSYIADLLQFELSKKHSALLGGICGIIFLYFFRGILIYTLSDFYAFSFSLVSVVLLHFIFEYKQSLYLKGVEAFLLGVCLYVTYNIRTIYLFSLIACFCLLAIWHFFKKKWLQLIITLVACLSGIIVGAVPQMIVNHNLSGTFSWKVPTEGLMLQQLKWGIWMERYATYIGDLSEYNGAAMYFADNTGLAILNNANMDLWTSFASYKEVLLLFLSQPMDFIGIYVRHLLNMLYPIYPEQYILSITKDKSILLILFYTILFIAISNFISFFKLKSSKWKWILLILLPCICILPGAVEIRFFIALHFLIYMYAVLGVKQFFLRLKKCKAKYISIYIVGLLVYIAYAGAMLSATIGGTAMINP